MRSYSYRDIVMGLSASMLHRVARVGATTAGPCRTCRTRRTVAPVVAGWQDGFFIQSANGDFRLQIGLLVHADGRFALDDDGRHVRRHVSRSAGCDRACAAGSRRRFEFYLNPDFAGGTLVVQDAYVDTVFSPGVSHSRRKGQDALRHGAAALGVESAVLRARAADRARAESRHRRAGARRYLRRSRQLSRRRHERRG